MALDIGRRTLEREVRAARAEDRQPPDVVIVGGGLSGLGMAIQLTRAGHRRFTIVEQSDGVGGTWRDNTYPGSGCDVPSHLYSFSFAPKTDWTRRFAEQPEILSYAEWCVDHYGLGPHLRINTVVDQATFDEDTSRWRLTIRSVDGTEALEADTVVFACGQLNRPFVPPLPGLDQFAGPQWHSARWDHTVDLTGRRVAVVGTGASAIQFVPMVAEQSSTLTLYQRSPNYVGPKKDRAYHRRTRKLLAAGGVTTRLYRWWIYWSLEFRWIWFKKDSWAGRKLRDIFTKGIRDAVVSERLPDAAVVPDYPVGCKRILISNDWYPTLLSPDVEVVDQPIDHVESDAVVTTDGRRRPADVLIFGTGFSATEFLSHLPVTGEGGRSLAEAWEDGARAYRGIAVPGFPNCYLLYGPNTNLGHNSILFMVERQINLVLQAVAAQSAGSGSELPPRVGVTEQAYAADDRRTQRLMGHTAWVTECRSWYKTASGRVTNNWPTWTVRYWLDTLWLRRDELGVTSRSGSAMPSTNRAVDGVGHHQGAAGADSAPPVAATH